MKKGLVFQEALFLLDFLVHHPGQLVPGGRGNPVNLEIPGVLCLLVVLKGRVDQQPQCLGRHGCRESQGSQVFLGHPWFLRGQVTQVVHEVPAPRPSLFQVTQGGQEHRDHPVDQLAPDCLPPLLLPSPHAPRLSQGRL